MTVGRLVALVQAADRVVHSLQRPTPERLLERFAELADDEAALERLHRNVALLSQALLELRAVPVQARVEMSSGEPPQGETP